MFRENEETREYGGLALRDLAALQDADVRSRPWEAEPNRVWSLIDMLRFYATSFATCIGALERSIGALATTELIGSPTFEEHARLGVQRALSDLSEAMTELPISQALIEHIARIRKRIDKDSQDVAHALVRELHNNVITELSFNYYLVIRTGTLREMYEQKSPPFGADTEAKFPEARFDISAASRCFALDEWTACVFHLMRVLEHGLRPIATKFNVPFATDSWHKVIKGIEDGLTALRNKQGLTDQDRVDIAKFSEIAAEFRHFKDAWRNHVSHGRTVYGEPVARETYEHVRSFMQKIAADVEEPPSSAAPRAHNPMWPGSNRQF